MKTRVVMMVVLVVLVVMSFVQGIQINNLEESFKDIDLGAVQKSSGGPTGAYTGSSGNAPAMVGGC